MGFFSRRRKRESALPDTADARALGSFANPDGQPVVGRQLGGGQPPVDLQGLGLTDGLAMLSQLGPMIQQAMASGNMQVSYGSSETIDARGTALGEEIKEIMRGHGIDPEGGGVSASANASDYMQMQSQIMEALSRHGAGPGAQGAGGTQLPPAPGGEGAAGTE